MEDNELFIHLRNHTEYSLLEGALRLLQVENAGTPAEKKTHPLPDYCKANNIPAIAMTDTSNMFGAMFFSLFCKDNGVKPVLGCLLNLALTPDNAINRPSLNQSNYLVFLVKNEAGYQNLIKLCSKAHLEKGDMPLPSIFIDDLRSHNEGLIVLAGGANGPIGNLILDGKTDKAMALLQELADIFKNHLYIEIQRHGLDQEIKTEPVFLDWAYKLNLPLVATNDCYFMDKDMFEAHDAMLCIADKTFVNVSNRRRLTPEHRFKTVAEMLELFSDLPEATINTVKIAKRCSFALSKLPPALPHFAKDEGKMLREKAEKGLQARLEKFVFTPDMTEQEKQQAAQPYKERLEYELSIIIKMDFPGYFLIVADFIQESKKRGIPVGPGRGSGAGSVVAWALTITDLNPLQFNLLFERFLNPERISMPDFDIDFCQERRGETLDYVRNKYGKDHVAQIITFGKLQARAVLRDVGRVLQIPYPVVDRICKLVPNAPGKVVTLSQTYESNAEFRDEIDKDESLKRLFEISVKLEGLNRNASTHAAGVVIGAKPLNEIAPLYLDPDSDIPVTQFDKNCVEDASLIKFDFLGLKTLTTIAKTLNLLKEKGIELDISSIPLDDKKTFDLLQRADTIGVFQLESSGMQNTLKDLKPDKLEDITAIDALFRPGPMDNIPIYTRRKNGQEEPDYLHPMLEGVLKETYGIMIYQEQVMQIAQIMGGYTLGGADLLRKAMGKKKLDEMKKQRQIFVAGAKERGVDETQATHIFDQMEKFAGYGFNKSHAACYAFIAYQTAYLKANYPLEFIAASMTMDSQSGDKLEKFKNELRAKKIRLLPPDINKARPEFSVEGDAVRFAFSAIKGVGLEVSNLIFKERTENGVFKSYTDFLTRLNKQTINKKTLESLIKTGAFDSLEPNRAALLDSVLAAGQFMDKAWEEKETKQSNLFAVMPEQNRFNLPPKDEWTLEDKLNHEKDALGFFLSAHPMDEYAKTLQRMGIKDSADILANLRAGKDAILTLAGIASAFKVRTGKTGKPYAIISASDSSGSFEIFCFSEILSANKAKLESDKPLLFGVTATKTTEDETPRLTLQTVMFLDEAASDIDEGITITVSKPECLPKISEVITAMKKGRGAITIIPKLDDWDIKITLPDKYAIPATALSAIRSISGVASVTEN